MTAAAVARVLLLGLVASGSAHRVDEYLQATTIAVSKERVHAQIRLTSGTDVYSVVRGLIDTDRDGVFSVAEGDAYARRVLADLTLRVDGRRLALTIVSVTFAPVEEMQLGRGAVQIDFEAAVPPGRPDRRLTFENHHQTQIAAYLVNGLVPRDPQIEITRQRRNYLQSSYEMNYTRRGVAVAAAATPSRFGLVGWLVGSGVFAAVLLLKSRRLLSS